MDWKLYILRKIANSLYIEGSIEALTALDELLREGYAVAAASRTGYLLTTSGWRLLSKHELPDTFCPCDY